MGTDALDMCFRCEKALGVRLDRSALIDLLRSGNTADPPEGSWTDLRVREFAAWVASQMRDQKIVYEGDVFVVVRRQIAECLAVDESEVTDEAWICRDLGAD